MRLPLPNVAAKRMVTGDQIAATAEATAGKWQYIFGGTPTATRLTGDCDSLVTWTLGYKLGLALPGGKWGQPGFPPTSHGPVVTSYASWSGAVTVQAPGARGDLVCFVGVGPNGHIGIVTGRDQMVSLLDPANGCKVTPITGYGPPGAPIVYRRVVAAAAGTVVGVATGQQPASGSGAAAAGEALLIVGAMVGAVLAAAVLVGTALAMGGSWVAMKLAADG